MEINPYVLGGICIAIAIIAFLVADPQVIDLTEIQKSELEIQKKDAVNIATTDQQNICNNKIYDLKKDYEKQLDESHYVIARISDRCAERYIIQRDFFNDVNASLLEIKQLVTDINYNNLNNKLTDLNKLVSDFNCE